MWIATFFSKNVRVNAILNDESYNDTLSYDIVSFEQLGPGELFANIYEKDVVGCLSMSGYINFVLMACLFFYFINYEPIYETEYMQTLQSFTVWEH